MRDCASRLRGSVRHGAAGVKVVVNGPRFDNRYVEPLIVTEAGFDIAVRMVMGMKEGRGSAMDPVPRIGVFPALDLLF